MRRCAFLTLQDPTGYVMDDELAREPMRELGWELDMVPWNRPGAPWEDYDLVAIRSPWDWMHAPEAFLAVLQSIVDRGVRLENPLPLVRWNLHKTYLRELAARGVPTVPTLFRERLEPGGLATLLGELGTRQAVLKPVVGANASWAVRIGDRTTDEVEHAYAARALMAQPFVRAIVEEGEYSLFYFGGAFSHAVRKRPKPGDFRVQEDQGGSVEAVSPTADLRAAADTVMAALDEQPVYARVDLVRGDAGAWWLMELELVEPALYLRMDPGAAQRFARALAQRAE
jgi:glutathione synthase/RimK-type ligase-like ATP-grasp enzyme